MTFGKLGAGHGRMGKSNTHVYVASQFFNDTFTGSNGTLLTAHTSDSGHTWSRVNGTGDFTIQTNRVYCVTSSAVVLPSITAPRADYYVEAVIDLLTDVGDNVGVVGRYDSSNNGYFVRYNQSTDDWSLFRMDAGTPSAALAAGFTDNWTTGSRTVRLDMRGPVLTVYINSTLRITATDSTYGGPGSPGLRIGNAQTSSTQRHVTSLIAFG